MVLNGANLQLALRPVADTDSDFLYSLYASTRAHEMAITGWPTEQQLAFLQMQFEAQSKFYSEQFTGADFNIIEREGKAIGRLYADERETEIRVIDIALLPEHTAQGIGSYYMQLLIDKALASKRKVTIHVEHNNPAMKLYQRLGFTHVRDEGIYWFMQWSEQAGQEKIAS